MGFTPGRGDLGGDEFVGYKRKIIALTNVATTARTLLNTESGALVTMDNSTNTATTITLTLPTAEAGLQYNLLVLKDGTHNNADIIITTGDNDSNLYGIVACDDNNFSIPESSNYSKITLTMANAKTCGGLILDVVCDGTDWGIVNSMVADTVANAIGGAGDLIMASEAA